MYQRNGKQILHIEGETVTHIADAGDAEKADFVMQAANSFRITYNYIDNALITLSPSWHGDKIAKHQFLQRFNAAIVAANELDKVKKTLFYGRDNGLIGEGQTPIGNGPLEHMGDFNADPRNIIHGVIGIFTEAGELLEMLRDAYNGQHFDPINMREEIGDMFWYVAILLHEASRDGDGYTFEDCMRVNIEKLRARFPDKFTEASANVRDLAAERAILEGKRPALPAEGVDPEDVRQHHIEAPGLAGALGVTVPEDAAGVGGLHEAMFGKGSTGVAPLITEAQPASGHAAVTLAAESAAQAFANIEHVGNQALPVEDLPEHDPELAKPTSARAAPFEHEHIAQGNAGERD